MQSLPHPVVRPGDGQDQRQAKTKAARFAPAAFGEKSLSVLLQFFFSGQVLRPSIG